MQYSRNSEQDKRIDKISGHVETMNKEFGEFKTSNSSEHASLKTDLDWLKKHYYIVATASIGGLIGAIFSAFK